MTAKRFLALNFAALLLSAAFIAGGCGGSSSNLASISDPDTTTDAEMPSMVSVFDSPEFELVAQELEAELASNDLPEPNIHVVVIISDDYFVSGESDDVSSAAAHAVRTSAILPEDKLAELSAKIKPYYDSGDVIALFWPSAATINDLYEAVGEPPMNIEPSDLLPTSEDTYPEMYAIAKRYNGDVAYHFSHVVAGNTEVLRDILEEVMQLDSGDTSGGTSADVSGEGSSNEPEDVDEKYAGMRPNYLFQARRYADFVLWAANIDAKMAEQREYVSSSEFQARAAALSNEAQSGELFNYGAQMIHIDVSYKDRWHSWCHYSAAADYTVYSFHNFGDKNDYYYVQATSFVKPEAYSKQILSDGSVKTYGSMRWYNYWHNINGATYNLFSHAPKNINRSRTLSDGTSYSTTRTTGHKVDTEVGMEISTEGVKGSAKVGYEYSTSTSKTTGYNHSATWTANDWEVIDQSDPANPNWRVDFKAPDYDSGGPNGYYPDWSGNVPEASTRRNDLDSEWMWQVSSSNKSISIRANLWSQMRETWCKPSDGRDNKYYTGKKGGNAPLNKPPHIIARPKKFDAEQAGDLKRVDLLCSGKWEAVSDSDWCQASPSSGEATGETDQTVFIYVKAFEPGEDLVTRVANIMLRDTESGQIQTIRVTQANQTAQR